MLTTFDRLLLKVLYFPIFPILFLLLFWWSSLNFLRPEQVWLAMLGGMFLGIVVALVLVPKMLKKGFQLSSMPLIAIYLFYTIGIFGFFMGVPVFNIIPGLIAAFYITRRRQTFDLQGTASNNSDQLALSFIMFVLTLICIASAYIALQDPYTAGNLKGMLGLNFEVQTWHIWTLILGGGAGLLLTQLLGYFMIRKLVLRSAL